MADKEKVFVDGLIFKGKQEKDPDFVKGHLAIKADDLIAFIQKHRKSDGWLNIDMKKSAGGKLYLELNTFVPKKKDEEEINPEDLPW